MYCTRCLHLSTFDFEPRTALLTHVCVNGVRFTQEFLLSDASLVQICYRCIKGIHRNISQIRRKEEQMAIISWFVTEALFCCSHLSTGAVDASLDLVTTSNVLK